MKNPQYELNAGSDRSRGKDILHFSSADGINSKNSFRDSEKATCRLSTGIEKKEL